MVIRKPVPSSVDLPIKPSEGPIHISDEADIAFLRTSELPRISPGLQDMNDPWADEIVERPDTHGRSRALLERSRERIERAREQGDLPSSLRIGPLQGLPGAAEGTQQLYKQPTDPNEPRNGTVPFNPAARGGKTEQPVSKEGERSASIWWETGTRPAAPPEKPPPSSLMEHERDDSPVNMTANLSLTDRLVSEYSPSFRPSNEGLGAQYLVKDFPPLPNNLEFSPPVSPDGNQPHNVFVPSSPIHQLPFDPPYRQPSTPTQGRTSGTSQQTNFSHRTTPSIGWDPGMDISALDADTSRNHGLPRVAESLDSDHVPRTWEEQQAWEKRQRQLRADQAAAAAERAKIEESERKAEEEWHHGEESFARTALTAQACATHERVNGQRHASGHSDIFPDPQGYASNSEHVQGRMPASLPPASQESAEWPPERDPQPQLETPVTGSGQSRSSVETPQSTNKRQRSETYQIKQICWHDASTNSNPRRSPILVQNANGPCPLLALVNALVLSTPAETTTALVETLRVREQVTLGLLIDAVFDELMSGRRGGAAQELPDVGDLYSFLVTLHTGMNVNPHFVALPPKAPNLIDASVLNLPLTNNEERKPGDFEETREMRLYSTFNIPLIHGWLPPRSHPAYQALQRSAKTYEDGQNLLFREEELEEKLRREGLRRDEQILLEDIASIKYFLSSSATQLTEFGLDTMTEAMYPGSIAILFRNDHFSTLYKHPQSNQLLTLVTDMGYAGHEEVVWESLVDISGEGCEFFAGDFRPVGNVAEDTQPQTGSTLADDEGWTTVQKSGNATRQSKVGSAAASGQSGRPTELRLDQTTVLPPSSPATEQEDHDLALALQLQEEEEDRHRRETAARRRENDLSQAFLISEEPSNQRARGRGQEVRPLVPPRGTPVMPNVRGTNDDGPPPSYEQAARGPAYHPPAHHPSHPQALPGSVRPGQGQGRQRSAYTQNVATHGSEMSVHHVSGPGQRRNSGARVSGMHASVGAGGSGVTRRRSAGIAGNSYDGDSMRKDKECVVM